MDAITRWASSGAMSLTGDPDGPPLAPPTTAGVAVDALLHPFGPGAEALSERAAHLGLVGGGDLSAGGATSLPEAADGRVALALPRADDWTSLPALLGVCPPRTVGRASPPSSGAEPSTSRSRWPPPSSGSLSPGSESDARRSRSRGEAVSVRRDAPARRRPVGALGFFDLLNEETASVAIDHTCARGRDDLALLVASADIVISSSRSRAIEQLGLDPREFFAAGADRVWVAVTGHACDVDRIGFGDNPAASAGLVPGGRPGSPRTGWRRGGAAGARRAGSGDEAALVPGWS